MKNLRFGRLPKKISRNDEATSEGINKNSMNVDHVGGLNEEI